MQSAWRNHDDVMADIWAMSELEGIASHTIDEPPPTSILEYRALIQANNTGSVFDSPMFGEDEGTPIISGRGKGGISTILRPGVSHLSDNRVTEDVQKKIREVSGLGYSNAFIEQGVRAMTMKNDPSAPPKKTPVKTSGRSTPMDQRSASSCSSLNCDSPVPAVDPGPPPPLSVMRQKAQEERARNKQKIAEAAVKKSSSRDSSGSRKINGAPWGNTSPGSSSDESSRRRNGNTASALFKRETEGFQLNCNDFPALQ